MSLATKLVAHLVAANHNSNTQKFLPKSARSRLLEELLDRFSFAGVSDWSVALPAS